MHTRSTFILLFVLIPLFAADTAPAPSPRDIVQAAIKAHGGKEKINKTITGKLTAKATLSLPGAPRADIIWEESFQLPTRYKRLIRGKLAGEDIRLEYAITNGSGWIRQNNGPVDEHKGPPLPLFRSWNAMLAILPSLLDENVSLDHAAASEADAKSLVAINVQSDEMGGTFYFDQKTGLLAKSERTMPNPLTGKVEKVEVRFTDYKEIAGVQYPMKITSLIAGKTAMELDIEKIEFLDKLDDKLFDRPAVAAATQIGEPTTKPTTQPTRP